MSKVSKKKPGRPKGYRSDNPHSERLAVNVTPDQMKSYKMASAKRGKTFSAWVREILDSACGSKKSKKGGMYYRP